MITLKTLDKATEQDVFDQVVKHMLTQMERSLVAKNSLTCLYKSPTGLKCAAGCLIGDDEYKEGMEGFSWDELVKKNIAPKKHSDLIRSLQSIHDGTYPYQWPKQLFNLSKELRLMFNPPHIG